MKFFWVKSKLFYSAAGHFVLFKTSRTADSKKKPQNKKTTPSPNKLKNMSARMQLPGMGACT